MKKRVLFTLACLLLWVGTTMAQVSRITGTVISEEDNEPIVGASVLVKGTTIGSITDVDGHYNIDNVPAGAKTLVISFVGMRTQEVDIRPELRIVMKNDSQLLGEVVVTVAYGSAKKSSLTGAISTVSQKEIEMRPTSSVTSALEGTTSGVQINSTVGSPGSDPSIRIRGIGTVNGNSSPLYVVDGVPFEGNISDLNPSDIESISVLKDAASAALYGNRASNGVILITTKKGTAGKLSFELKISQGTYSRGTKEYKRTDPRQFMEVSWQDLKNSQMTSNNLDAAAAAQYASKNLLSDYLYLNIFNKADDALFDANGKLTAGTEILPGYAEDLDWYDQSIRNGYRQEYVFSGNASHEKSDYYFSLAYLDEQGYMKNSGFDRLSGRLSVNLSPKKWIKTGLNLNVTHQNYNNTTGGDSDDSNSFKNVFMYCRNIAPIYPVHLHNSDGSYMLDGNGDMQYDPGHYITQDENGGDLSISTRNQYVDRHVIWENELDQDKTVRNTMNATAYADLKFLRDFTFTVRGHLNLRNSDRQAYDNAVIGNGKDVGRSKKTSYRYKNYTFQQQLRWSHDYDGHGVDVLLGHENFSYNYDYTYGFKTKETFANKPFFSNFSEMSSMSGYQNNYRTESYLGRLRYNYKDTYNLEVSFRRDGSSRFHKNNRWGNFGSVGANWIISQEKFMKPLKWVDNLKFRANWGQVGNDAGSGYYAYMSLYTSDVYNEKGAYYLSQNEAPDLKWETGEAYGFALESRLFDRWNLSVEYFDKRNKDLIFDVYLPLSAGATSSSKAEAVITKNLGTMSNRGWEIATDIDVFRNKDWTVNVGTNATFIKNKVMKLPEQNKNGIISGNYKVVEGKSRYEYYTYTFMGIDQLTGNSLYKPNTEDYYFTMPDGTVVGNTGNAEATDVTDKMTFINGQAYATNVTYAGKDFHGSALPVMYGSFSGNVSYKSLTFSAIFTYSLGGKTMDGVYQSLMSTSATPGNYHADILNSWMEAPAGMTETSPDRILANGIPQINSSLSSNNNQISSRFLTSSDYLVLKNISLNYRLPKAWVKKLDLQSIGLNVTCENLFTITARQGLNPQQSFSGSQNNMLVTPRIFTVGLNIKL